MPPDGGTSRSQRLSRALTCLPSPASGVINAAVAPGVSSASRKARAARSASSASSSASSTVKPERAFVAKASGASGAAISLSRSSQSAVWLAGARLSCSRRLRAWADASTVIRGQTGTSLAVSFKAFSVPASENCGWSGSPLNLSARRSVISCHMVSGASPSSPGKTTSPRGIACAASINCCVAGVAPVDPATINGPLGGWVRSVSATASATCRRRSNGSLAPFSSSHFGHSCVTISRNLTDCDQCSARSVSCTRSGSCSQSTPPARLAESNRRPSSRAAASVEDGGIERPRTL